MGMEAKVIVFGKFELMKQVPDALDYPIDFYEITNNDTIVFGTILSVSTNDGSRALADMCHCDPWDFNTHKIHSVNWPSIYETDTLFSMGDFRLLEACISLGLEVYYQPNG
jgi:hypothetical protein